MTFYEYFKEWFNCNHTKTHTMTVTGHTLGENDYFKTECYDYEIILDGFRITKNDESYTVEKYPGFLFNKLATFNDDVGLQFHYYPPMSFSLFKEARIFTEEETAKHYKSIKENRKELDSKIICWFNNLKLNYELSQDLNKKEITITTKKVKI